MSLLAFGLAYAGFCGLCLAMNRHHGDVFGAPPSPRRARLLRLGGWLGVAASWAPCVAHHGITVGSVLWVGLLGAASLSLVLLLPYRPRLSVGLALGMPLGGALLLPFAG
ncbi:DUF3325 domain-containing protein [Pseudomonas mangiferae]|uniref:DUF3325 domain-containing protein n=1 Tax=Pseudomonas mangiferae TaxID=2593654 RepID=A0A553GW32_9PSED|nr:DUF3325 domain-containing protein [Pseudomonas mangiferae]TRX73695.1 DUF3325 domain-containing protein [Pseudomonas mangiferae]